MTGIRVIAQNALKHALKQTAWMTLVWFGPALAWADCSLLTEAESGKILLQQGQCERRLPPNSTFKIPIALMAYDAGLLQDEKLPMLDFKPGYADWMDNWKQPINPGSWMKYSVVWYSQVLTQQLGMARFQNYLQGFDYGNQDASGDAGKENGITNSWLSSSLRISPLEQLHFVRKLVSNQLPVSAHALAMTKKITYRDLCTTYCAAKFEACDARCALAQVRFSASTLTARDSCAEVSYLESFKNGWQVHGKTGTCRLADGSAQAQDHIGWFIGWASKGQHSIVFVHQIQDQVPTEQGYAGPRAKAALLTKLPELLQQVGAAALAN